MVEIVNAISAGVRRPIQFFHLPVPKPRTDDAYFAPLEGLRLRPETELYLGLVHHDDAAGNAARLAAARRHARVDGVATECGMARGDPAACRHCSRRTRRPRSPPPADQDALVWSGLSGISTPHPALSPQAGRGF